MSDERPDDTPGTAPGTPEDAVETAVETTAAAADTDTAGVDDGVETPAAEAADGTAPVSDAGEPAPDEAPRPSMDRAQLEAIVEALVFASPEPLTPKMLFKLLADEPKDDVQAALDAKLDRANRVPTRVRDEMLRGRLLVATEGARVGQVNGLSVVDLGGVLFGLPTRITARVRLGGGNVVDIERESELGGPIHSKGVMILTGYLAAHYAPKRPMSLAATLVFEQSYGMVEGDSASSTELYALLSALADVPVSNALAITGSVNQHGDVQAIGGVNEKIEGYFDLCRLRGLDGRQGVIIPSANASQLMLRQDVVDAVAAGKFAIHAVETIDQGLEVLTGRPAGERDRLGRFPDGTLNARIEERLADFAERARAFGAQAPRPQPRENGK